MKIHEQQTEHALRRAGKHQEPPQLRSSDSLGNQAGLSRRGGLHAGAAPTLSAPEQDTGSAFDAHSGQILSAMSQGAAPISTQAPIQARKGEISDPKVWAAKREQARIARDAKENAKRAKVLQKTNTPKQLADLAIRMQRAQTTSSDVSQWVSDNPINYAYVGGGGSYDFAPDRDAILDKVSALPDEQQEAFRQNIVNNYMSSAVKASKMSTMDQFSEDYYNIRAGDQAMSSFLGGRNSLSYMRNYMQEQGGQEDILNAANAGIEVYRNAGTGMSRSGQTVQKPQSFFNRRDRLLDRMYELDKNLLPWRKRLR